MKTKAFSNSLTCLFLFFILFPWASALRADPYLQAGAQLIQGDSYAFFISAPLGWILDKDPGTDSDSEVVLYPKGTSYRDAPSVIYVDVIEREPGKTLQKLIQEDLDDVQRQNPQVRAEVGPAIYTRLQKSAWVRFYWGLKNDTAEALAYIEEKDVFVIMTLSSSHSMILQEDLPALQELINSYENMGKKANS